MADTGDIRDNSEERLKGGRLGVYCDSQEDITWSAAATGQWIDGFKRSWETETVMLLGVLDTAWLMCLI